MASTPKTFASHPPARRCKYCRCNFVPERAQDKDAKFCCPNHRKAYWRFGGLPYDKMREQIMKDVRRELKTEYEALLAMLAQFVPGLPFKRV